MCKLFSVSRLSRWFSVLAALTLFVSAQAQTTSLNQPSIVSIKLDGDEVVVLVQVPSGVTKLSLESRTRVGLGAWVPALVKRLNGDEKTVVFRLKRSAKLELLRVRADAQEALPASFFQGTNTFNGAAGSAGGMDYRFNDATGVPTANPTPGVAEKTDRAVVESDIWKIQGDTLYFFNQYRGLQIFDLSQPATPAAQGTLNIPASGEQMYVLDSGVVVLLAGNVQYYTGNDSESQVIVVGVTNGIPTVITNLAVPGTIQESRLVGTALYVASQTYQQVVQDTKTYWEWGSHVVSFDLSNPYQPTAKTKLWYSGYGNVVSATESFLFVATTDSSNWRSSQVRCVDISAPDGVMFPLATINPAGQVKDKFKINVNGDVLTVISEAWSDTRRWVTTLETFSLANPVQPVKLGRLELAAGEQLHATRFDGNRVYVVTFLRVDPLWVVDLSDPAKPVIKGELQVPGWSTYIQPLGDKLITIGIDNSNNWRTAVSLFDVKDPSKPTLISKVPLGESSSWSEANYDEKAFNVLADAGLILVPYQGYTSNSYAQRVQLIDLSLTDPSANALKLRGTIEHQFQPRRATVFEDFILSISGKELISVEAANRDNPLVRSTTELAWTVNQVFAKGDFLLEVAYGGNWWWNEQVPSNLRVTPNGDPNKVLSKMELTNGLPIVGATVKGDFLYLAQAGYQYFPLYLANVKSVGTTEANADTNPPPVILTVVDISKLPALSVVGQEKVQFTNYFTASSLAPLWVNPNLLIWVGSGGGYYYGGPLMVDAIAPIRGGWYPWYWGGGGSRFLAFDTTSSAAPRFISDYTLNTTNQWWNYSDVFTADGLLYLSHQSSEFLEGVKPPYAQSPTVTYDDKTGIYITNQPPLGTWVQRYYLDVVDYADPANPTARKPVNIPGVLRGVAYNGSLLYTVAPHWQADWTTDWSDWLDAVAYDGLNASLVTSLALPKDWPHPVQFAGPNMFLGRPNNTDQKLNLVESWKLDQSGKWAQLGTWSQTSPASDMRAINDVLVLQNNDYTIKLLDIADPAKPALLGKVQIGGYVWGDLRKGDLLRKDRFFLPLGDYGVSVISAAP